MSPDAAPFLPFTVRPREPDATAGSANMRQLIHLRWLAVVGQLVTILFVNRVMGVQLPVGAMLGVLAMGVAINLLSQLRLRFHHITNTELLFSLMFDVGMLTLQLFLSGGATNPFISLYLIQVVLGAVLLETWSACALAAITGLCFGLLSLHHRPLVFPVWLFGDIAGLHTLGNWLGFALVAGLLILFVTRISHNLRENAARIADFREQASEEEHIVRMGLLASGAAHELGTPLASLSVILSDWRRMPKLRDDPELMGEIAEMQAEVQRCKAIVTRILQSAGEPRGEAAEQSQVGPFIDAIVTEWRISHAQVPLDYHPTDDDAPIVSDPAIKQAVWNVLDNAAEASPHWVGLNVARAGGAVTVCVADRGPGFTPETLAQVGRPQRSTKGEGHGVGLFLVSSVIRKLGGRVEALNRPEGGALVTLTLPLNMIGISDRTP
ncbi:ATP-binding protein [Sphingomonadaceae bacterium jetA1]|jgi:two-component system sensor histidine kinase RegB|uniref:ATP-binding protein n=1 Tax=Facivitalis istanbulensis TaxID=3075838 RepID=UPI00348132E5